MGLYCSFYQIYKWLVKYSFAFGDITIALRRVCKLILTEIPLGMSFIMLV